MEQGRLKAGPGGDGAEIHAEGGLVETRGFFPRSVPGALVMLTLGKKDCLTRQGFRGPLRRQPDSRRKRKEGWKEGGRKLWEER